ncbi:MAG: hypothetical protein CO129_07330 [Ignavibacteriales bacterium CG_4_9_14_3_um_filter_34_10]|nr:MAG: hypothetical protein CO129_07330 [Ignavibacteriales bacterium CG_4_9_14_3_um_filter_34_10]
MLFKIILIILTTAFINLAQSFSINKIEPPNWWVGMKHNKIQLMVYGNKLENVKAKSFSKHIKIKKIHQIENSSYLFVDIEISNRAKAGDNIIRFYNDEKLADINFPLFSREKSKNRFQGFDNKDVIYLLMPDRFANGDTTNDFVEGYYDSLQVIPSQARKGGDIAGIISKLDYIKNFGATAIWITPLVENNTFRSYHGYSATNHYKIDPRLGTINNYKTLVDSAHQLGMKIIMDHVANHIAIDHEWMKNLPMKNWINGSVQNHLPANHNKMSFLDIHSDSITIREIQEGWFTGYMPDLNHENIFLSTYLIQNTIWWIETSGIDGIREDTYPYCNQKFMSLWAKEIIDEYPSLKILGEIWTGESDYLAGYQSGSQFPKYDSHLANITDFALRDALVHFLQGSGSLYEIFNTVSKDYLFADANNLVTFADNHDVGRAMFYADSNVAKFKLAFHILLTTRGIPQIFYGTEIGMIQNEDHGTLRKPFPGGFPGDKRNAFTVTGRNEYENDIFNFLQKIIKIRNDNPALSEGKIIHFSPVNNVYIYFRQLGEDTFMNIINAGKNSFKPNTNYYRQLNGVKFVYDELNERQLSINQILVEGESSVIFKLIK